MALSPEVSAMLCKPPTLQARKGVSRVLLKKRDKAEKHRKPSARERAHMHFVPNALLPHDAYNYQGGNAKYHCGRKRYIINSETFSACNQHVKFTFINSQEFHACISYMPAHIVGNDTHVRAMKIIQIIFYMWLTCIFTVINSRKYRSCRYLYCPRW